jgi:hypothetical protein
LETDTGRGAGRSAPPVAHLLRQEPVEYDRNVAGAILAGTLFVISGAVLSVIGVRELTRRKNRLVTGNLVGCWALVTLAVIAAAFGILFYVVFMYYSSMARPH